MNFDSITFEELVDTIQQAKENNDFERLQLIKLALSRVTTDPGENLSQSALYSEALNLNWGYSNSPNWYLNERSYASKEQRFDKLKELNSLFQAMHQAGFTKNFSKGSVQLDGETRNVTRAELNYYRFYFSDFYLNLMKIQASSPQGQATVQSSATVFLAEIALVNDFLPTDSEYQSRGKDWLAKVQYYTGSTSKETLIRSLTENSLEDPGDTSLIVGLIGYLEAREGNIDDGLKLLNCAATKYGDELAMSNLGEIYGWERHRQSFMKTWESAPEASKAGLKKSVNPIYLSEKTLPDDIKKSLYWSLLVEKIDPFRNGIFTYADNQLGWNNIGRIDSIVNMRLISKEEISEASCDMLVTLAKIYPEVPPLYEPSGCIK